MTPEWQEPAGQPPTTFSPEDGEFLQQVYEGADQADLQLAGISYIDEITDSFAGSKDSPVKIGQRATLAVRVGENGELLPRRGDTDKAATSLLRLQVYPDLLWDSSGDSRVVWIAHARQVDVPPGDGRDDSLGDWSLPFGPDSEWLDITITPTESGADVPFDGVTNVSVAGDFNGDGEDDLEWWEP